ncbi:unnamed protein product [Adineta ricciae]|uniref:Uncharacterized protein n=1 Tax=Adineta ricciae TaxID=249248 RepID=A0A815UP45_ADIRI|nr:unnamed protein product [Adineta ricciae]CAF1587821.1 unnamed protein product [Adineta ricciae]
MANSLAVNSFDLCCCVPVTCEEIDDRSLVHVKAISWNTRFNRGYCTKNCTKHNTSTIHTYWTGRLASSPEQYPYYVPSTWYRLSVDVDTTSLLDWSSNWHTLYHGTDPHNIHKILKNGFRVRECQHGFPALYLSPSIHYSSHPRYAGVVLLNSVYFQFVLEVRVDTRKLMPLKINEFLQTGVQGDIDPNFPNNENLEFLLKAHEGIFIKPCEGVVVTGIMVRKLNFDPVLLPSSWWWCKWRNWMNIQKYYNNGAQQNFENTD